MTSAKTPSALSLEQLQPLHAPSDVSWWPPALGWWGLLVLVAIIAFVLTWWLRRQRQSRWRKQALAELEALTLRRGELSSGQWLNSVNTLLKRVCLTRYPRAQIAGLSGQAWLRFLEDSTPTKGFIDGPGACLGSDRYGPQPQDLPAAPLVELVRAWLRQVP